MAGGRTLHVRCTTWEQVEVFHTRKLRRGKLLSMKVPFHSDRGAAVTLNLELPNRVVIAIEGTVLKSSPAELDPKSAKPDTGKTWLEVELIGFTEEIVAQIRRMAAGHEPAPELMPEPPAPVVRTRRPSGPRSAPQGPQSAAQSAPHSAPASTLPRVPQNLPSSVSQGLPPSIPRISSQAIPQSALPGSQQSASQAIPQAIHPGISQNDSRGIPPSSLQSVSQGIPRNILQGDSQAIPQRTSPGAPQSGLQGIPQSLSQGIPQSVSPPAFQSAPQSIPRSVSQSTSQGIPQSISRTVSQGVSQSITDELSADERTIFQRLTAELRRLRSVAVHEVLGVPRDADAEAIRLGWMDLMRRYHPDLVARRNAPAISHLAEELTILANRAYDRLRVALVAEGRATSVGPVLTPPPGWLVGFDDIESTGSILRAKLAQTLQSGGNAPQVEPIAPPQVQGGEGGEAFEQRARAMLGDGDADNAQEVLAAALCVYPRSRPLRSLYYVASAVSALTKGEVMLATSQLETAIAHHEGCSEAAALLELLRRPNTPVADEEMTRLFR